MRSGIAVLACLSLAIAGCGDRAPGIIITEDGRMMDNSAENNRAEAVRTIEHELQKQLGEHWRATAAIAELPTWSDERGDGDWRWQKATVTVALLGDGAAPLPLPAEEIREGVARYLHPKVERPKANLSVEVTQATDAAAFARSSEVVPAAKPVSCARTYVVQAGDTLADISTACYGRPELWRRIVEANPGVDPAKMQPGTVLVVPLLPVATEAAKP